MLDPPGGRRDVHSDSESDSGGGVRTSIAGLRRSASAVALVAIASLTMQCSSSGSSGSLPDGGGGAGGTTGLPCDPLACAPLETLEGPTVPACCVSPTGPCGLRLAGQCRAIPSGAPGTGGTGAVGGGGGFPCSNLEQPCFSNADGCCLDSPMGGACVLDRYGSRCQPRCLGDVDCASGCCKGGFCARAELCSANAACTQNPQCGNGYCLDIVGAGQGLCSAWCGDDSECAGGCCVQTDGLSRACAPGVLCQ